MVWTSIWPDVTKSVSENGPTGVANAAYTETTMNLDHYWNNSSNNDGHHKFVQMTQTGTAAVPADATLATGMEGNIYLKAKSATESPDNQDVQPFLINNEAVGVAGVTQISQLLGIRACCCFDVDAVTKAITIKYAQNITSIALVSVGIYTATFTNNLPSNSYLALGSGIINATAQHEGLLWQILTSATVDPVKSVSRLRFATTKLGQPIDPVQCWFVCFGG